MQTLLTVLAVGGIGAVVYSYLLYPLVLFAVAAVAQALRDAGYVLRKTERRQTAADEAPAVAIVISAYNEERHLTTRIDNLLALDYPAERWQAYLGSDGSSDGSAAILVRHAGHPRLRCYVFAENRGKASVLNDLVARSDAEILVFSDANTLFEPGALRQLVAPFADWRVGAVCGELRLTGNGGDNQDGLYWRIEQFLKFFESRLGALLGANGGIYAIRRSLWTPLAADTICDDFCIAMNVAAAGGRVVYAPNAVATEEMPAQIEDEYRRRLRIGIGNFQALLRHPAYLLRTSAATRFAYLSHKVLRWIAPHLLLLSLAASVALAAGGSAAWLLAALAQAGAYALAALLYARTRGGAALARPLKLAAFLFALNWAFLVASWRYARGRYGGAWQRTRR